MKEFTACHNAPKVICVEFENGDSPTLEVLLVANVLISGDEEIEFCLRFLNQFSVFYSMPTAFLGGSASMTDENFVHRPWDALVEEDFHAAAKSADSERSKTSTAISRVTVGKHSRNSSSV